MAVRILGAMQQGVDAWHRRLSKGISNYDRNSTKEFWLPFDTSSRLFFVKYGIGV